MKSEAALQPPFRGNNGFIEGNGRMMREVVDVRAGIQAEGTGLRLLNKPWSRFGIEGLAVFGLKDFGRAQIVPVGIRQRDGRNGLHHILQLHQLHQALFRINVHRIVQLVITRKERRGAGEDKIVAPQQRLRVVGRHIVGKVAVNVMIIFEKIFPLGHRGKHRDKQEAD